MKKKAHISSVETYVCLRASTLIDEKYPLGARSSTASYKHRILGLQRKRLKKRVKQLNSISSSVENQQSLTGMHVVR